MFHFVSDLFTYKLRHVTLSIHLYLYLHAIWLLYVLVELHSDNTGPVCLDSGTWIEGDHTVADQAYLEEQAAL